MGNESPDTLFTALDGEGKPGNWSWVDPIGLRQIGQQQAVTPTNTIPTPFYDWNRACRDAGGGLGLAPGWFVVVAGMPGAGKSLLALNLAASAIKSERRVAYLSYEMSRLQLLVRLMAIMSGCVVRNLERGESFNAATWTEATETCLNMGLRRLHMRDQPPRRIDQLRPLLQEAVEEWGAQLLVVDYIQLVGRSEDLAIFDRTMRVSEELQRIAGDLGVTVVGLSQFNRLTTANRKEEPGAAGLKGGTLDEDADQVVLIDHSSTERSAMTAKSHLLLAKNRHGPNSKIPIRWDYGTLIASQYTSMDEAQERIRRIP